MVIFRRAVQLLAELVVVASCWKLISDMKTSLGIVTFNAQSATNRARLTQILNEFSGVDIACLQGTKHAATNIEVSHMKISNCTVYRWPAGKGAHTSAAAGVAIAVNNKMFSDQYRRDVWNAPENLQGRAGAVRFTKRNCFDWCFITAYFPVNGQDPEGSASLTKWIDSVLSQLPTNCIPIIGTDANGKLRWTRVSGYLVKEDAGHVVGPHQPEIETQNCKMFREFLCSITCKLAILGMNHFLEP